VYIITNRLKKPDFRCVADRFRSTSFEERCVWGSASL